MTVIKSHRRALTWARVRGPPICDSYQSAAGRDGNRTRGVLEDLERKTSNALRLLRGYTEFARSDYSCAPQRGGRVLTEQKLDFREELSLGV